MDNATRRHLRTWIAKEFNHVDDDQCELLAQMVEQYETDPELYDNAGWWRCYDDLTQE